MSKRVFSILLLLLAAFSATAGTPAPGPFFINLTGEDNSREWAQNQAFPANSPGTPTIEILYPYHETLFPPELPPPEILWKDLNLQNSLWLVQMVCPGSNPHVLAVCATTTWSPPGEIWEACKSASQETPMDIRILGFSASGIASPSSWGKVSVMTSKDPVGAPIFFRDVSLPFKHVVQHMDEIKWRLGDVSSATAPKVILEKLSVCGNCHSFSQDGTKMGMDADFSGDKGAYIIATISQEINLNKENVISWSDFRREEGGSTFGLLARFSPDGRHIIASVKDAAVFIPQDDFAFSQLFFPIKGILGVYDIALKSISALPGADDPRYIQTSSAWSPDGQTILFARAPVSQYVPKRDHGRIRKDASPDEVKRDLKGGTIRYDIYQIPFNEGKGGKPEPLAGAGNNGKSNFFPRFTPDGKWVVFTQSNSFMLLQPDSQLFILPAAGGSPRLMKCNRALMNSWHSFSPNGRWMVFSSKTNTPYTQLFLTHIDEQGNDSPPVLLKHFTEPNRAANIPEFINIPVNALQKITEAYVDKASPLDDALNFFHKTKEFDKAETAIRKHLGTNPGDTQGWTLLGEISLEKGNENSAIAHFQKAMSLNAFDPAPVAHLAGIYEQRGKRENAHELLFTLGQLYTMQKDYAQAEKVILKFIAESSEKARGHLLLGKMHVRAGDLKKAETCVEAAILQNPQDQALFEYLKDIRAKQGKK